MRKTKYEKLAAYLQCEFIDGKEPMSPLPSIPKLMESQSVSQATVDRAMGLLEQQGLIIKMPGVGCFVSEQANAVDENETVDYISHEIQRGGWIQRPPLRTAVCSLPGQDNPMWLALAEAMAEEYAHLKLDLVYHNVDMPSFRRLLNEEKPLDILYLTPSSIDWLVREGMLMDLSGYDRPWEDEQALPELAAQNCKYVVPYSYVARVVLYDKKQMSKYDYDFSAGWSWYDFRKVCKELRTQVPGHKPVLLLDDYRSYFTEWGIELIDPATPEVNFQGDLVEEALCFLKSLFCDLAAFPLCSSLDLSKIVDVLRGGYPALSIGRTPWKTRLERMGTDELGMWPVPLGENGFQTMAINYLGVYAYSYFPEMAWDAIRYICSPNGQKVIDRAHQEFPLFGTCDGKLHANEMLRRYDQSGMTTNTTELLHQTQLPVPIMDELTHSVLNPEIEAFLQGHTDAASCMARISRIGTTLVRHAIAHRRRIGLL